MTETQRIGQQQEAKRFSEGPYICPHCGAQCHFMGIDFKAPRISDVKAWREVEEYSRSGKVYYRSNQ